MAYKKNYRNKTTLIFFILGLFFIVSMLSAIFLTRSKQTVKNYAAELTDSSLAPTLISPKNGYLHTTILPVFQWNALTGVTNYIIQVSENSSMPLSELVINKNTTLRSFKPASPLAKGHTYYWRVRAIYSDGTVSWSVKWSFRVADPPPPPDILSSQETSTKYPRVKLNWKSYAVPPARFEIQLADEATFTNPLYTFSDISGVLPSGSSFYYYSIPVDLIRNKTYYIRLRAFNGFDDASAFTKSFFVTPLLKPKLYHPVGGETVLTLYPNFQWDSYSYPYTNYPKRIELEVNTDRYFKAGPAFLKTDIVGTVSSFKIPIALAANTTYYWRLRAIGLADWATAWVWSYFKTP